MRYGTKKELPHRDTTRMVNIGGVVIGNIFGNKYKSKAEFAGGLILVLIGVKILVEHLGIFG